MINYSLALMRLRCTRIRHKQISNPGLGTPHQVQKMSLGEIDFTVKKKQTRVIRWKRRRVELCLKGERWWDKFDLGGKAALDVTMT